MRAAVLFALLLVTGCTASVAAPVTLSSPAVRYLEHAPIATPSPSPTPILEDTVKSVHLA